MVDIKSDAKDVALGAAAGSTVWVGKQFLADGLSILKQRYVRSTNISNPDFLALKIETGEAVIDDTKKSILVNGAPTSIKNTIVETREGSNPIISLFGKNGKLKNFISTSTSEHGVIYTSFRKFISTFSNVKKIGDHDAYLYTHISKLDVNFKPNLLKISGRGALFGAAAVVLYKLIPNETIQKYKFW